MTLTDRTNRSRSRLRTTAVAAVGLLTAALTQATPAHSAPATAGQAAAPVCTQRQHNSEFLSCLAVTAKLDAAPAVGATATLTATVRSEADFANLTVRFELPAQLVWTSAPAGFATSRTTVSRPERAGQISVAELTRSFAAGESATYTGVVRAVGTGKGQIEVRASAAAGRDVHAGQDTVYLTVSDKTGGSTFGHDLRSDNLETAPAGTPVQPTSTTPFQSAAPSPTDAQLAAPCDTRAAGRWSYQDQTGTWRASRNITIEVWDTANGRLTSGLTNATGDYNLCFDSTRGRNIFIRVFAENNFWRVQSPAGTFNWTTGTLAATAGTTVNFGSLTTGDATQHRALHAYDEANDAWTFIPKPNNQCWDQNDGSCRKVVILWSATSTDGTVYQPGTNDVHLLAADPDSQIVVVHEITHAIMDDVYNDAFPPAPMCAGHRIETASSTGCAWVEGFAEWFPSMVYNDPFFRWPTGATRDLENQTGGGVTWATGDTTEGRVAGALIDISDSNNEGPWDRHTEGFSNIWFTFMHHISNNLLAFWTSRAIDGFNVFDSGALACLFQNTIDYGFRDPLASTTPLSRPTPTTAFPHNFGFNTTSSFFSAVAVRPPSGADYDLRVFDERAQTTELAVSQLGGNGIDFVVVDTNRRPTGDYWPRVTLFSGSGNYLVELAATAVTLSAGSQTISMGTNNIVLVRDTFINAGTTVTITVTPTSGSQDPELFLFSSDAANPATFVKNRLGASVSATSRGAGLSESITFTAPTTAWYGIVVTKKAGSGNMTLTRA